MFRFEDKTDFPRFAWREIFLPECTQLLIHGGRFIPESTDIDLNNLRSSVSSGIPDRYEHGDALRDVGLSWRNHWGGYLKACVA